MDIKSSAIQDDTEPLKYYFIKKKKSMILWLCK